MKFTFLYTLLAMLFTAFLFLSNSGGRAAVANEGNTGAPGDNAFNNRTCQTCHNSAAIQVALNISALDLDGNPVDAYQPGETYRLRVNVNAAVGSPLGYGFQLVSLLNNGQSPVNSWSNPAGNVKLSTPSNGRQYAEHASVGANNTFEADWTAPAAGAGAVTFYAAGNGVNLNGNTSGDGAAQTSFQLPEAGPVAAEERKLASITFDAVPNPATDLVQLRFDLPGAQTLSIALLNLQGQTLVQEEHTLAQGQHNLPLHLNQFPAGIYLLQLKTSSGIQTLRLLKQ